MPSSHNSCNKVDASDARASRRLVGTLSRERRTFSVRDLCPVHSPQCGECTAPNTWAFAHSECQRLSRSVGHKSCRRSPTTARDASRQSRVDFRVESGRVRHGVRLVYAQEAYHVDGGFPIDRRAERCSATACVAHVRRRSLCSRQQLLVSHECQVLIPQVPGGVNLSYPCHTDRQRRSGSALGARTPEVSNRVRPGRATSLQVIEPRAAPPGPRGCHPASFMPRSNTIRHFWCTRS